MNGMEGQGFEPWKGVNPCRFSRPVHSAALPSLQELAIIPLKKIAKMLKTKYNRAVF